MKQLNELVGLPIKDAIVQISKGILEAVKILSRYSEMPKLNYGKLTFKISKQSSGEAGFAVFVAYKNSKSSLFEEEITYEISPKKQKESTNKIDIPEVLTFNTAKGLELDIENEVLGNVSLIDYFKTYKIDDSYGETVELNSIPIHLEIASDIVRKASHIILANRELNGGLEIESMNYNRLLTITKTNEFGLKLEFFGGEQGANLKEQKIIFHKIDLLFKNK